MRRERSKNVLKWPSVEVLVIIQTEMVQKRGAKMGTCFGSGRFLRALCPDEMMACALLILLTFVLVPQPTFGQQAQTKFLGLREISFWAGTCDTRGHGPPAHSFSLPFYTSEGAWPLGLPQPIHLALRARVWSATTLTFWSAPSRGGLASSCDLSCCSSSWSHQRWKD